MWSSFERTLTTTNYLKKNKPTVNSAIKLKWNDCAASSHPAWKPSSLQVANSDILQWTPRDKVLPNSSALTILPASAHFSVKDWAEKHPYGPAQDDLRERFVKLWIWSDRWPVVRFPVLLLQLLGDFPANRSPETNNRIPRENRVEYYDWFTKPFRFRILCAAFFF